MRIVALRRESWFRGTVECVAVALAMVVSQGLASGTAFAQRAAPCSAPEARQFDFWVGEWDLAWTNADGTAGTGTNRVESLLDGCAIHENFASNAAKPLLGRSYSVYSPKLGKWQQTWVDNGGGYLDFTGGWVEGRMVLSREGVLGNGRPGRQRMTFRDIGRDALAWDWETSEDGGATWTLRWQIRYTRRK